MNKIKTDKQNIKSSPRDIFMYLLGTGALYFSVYAVLNIVFEAINSFFPDPLAHYSPESSIRWPLALLVVIFPVYIWVSRFLSKDIWENPEKGGVKIRRWLLYLTIFLAAILLMGDLVTLIFRFLEGDLTTPFILKIISVLAVAATVFWYYLYDLKRKPKEFSQKARIFAWVASIAVFAVIVMGFFVAGSPFRQRLARFDSQKIANLQDIQWRVVNYWQQKGELPESLDNLRDDISGFIPPIDQQSKEVYEYRATGDLTFELCANFNLMSKEELMSKENVSIAPRPIGPYGEIGETWDHGEGRHCFSRTIDPEIYKVSRAAPAKF